jgi:uncharacterized protein
MTRTSPNRPFVVHVARLRRAPGTSWHEVRRGTIDDLACVASAVPPGATLEADVVLQSVAGGIAVRGTVRGPWHGECRRCLLPTSGTVEVAVLEHYTEGGDGDETYPLTDDRVDLEPLVRDAVMLELPPVPLCTPDCQGLCPQCGANRNEQRCACRPVTDGRWAALDVLRVPDGSSDH